MISSKRYCLVQIPTVLSYTNATHFPRNHTFDAKHRYPTSHIINNLQIRCELQNTRIVQIHPPQPTNLLNHHAFALCEGFLLRQLGHIWTQHLTQLFGDPPVIFLNGMSVNAKREVRSWSVSESLLAYLHGCIEPIHQASVSVSECMKPAAPNPKGFKQRVQLPFHD